MARLVLTQLLLLLVLAGCSCGPKAPEPLTLTVKQTTLTVELAATPLDRARGFVGRKHVADDQALLLADVVGRRMEVNNRADSLALSLAFIRDDWTIAEIVEMKPESSSMPEHLLEIYTSSEPVRYALQVAGGWFGRKKVVVGDKLILSKSLETRIPAALQGTLWVGEIQLTVDLALSEETRRHGLMWRESMPENAGMLFIEKETRQMAYWMGNCRMPISIAFVREDLTIANIHEMIVEPEGRSPDDYARYPSKGKVKYALEMNAGWFEKKGIGPGTKLRFSPELQKHLEQVR